MVITPNSDVILLKCPLELDQENQLNFANATTQYNYFYGLSKYVAGTDFTYQRKDNIIRISAKYDDLISYNYVMYRNDNYSNKWFYAFIEKMEYINDGMTSVKIKTDTFQTWQFDLTYKRTFVEREHTNDDTVGANTIEEGLEFGEYVISNTHDVDLMTTSGTFKKGDFVMIGVTETPDHLDGVTMTSGAFSSSNIYNGIPSGLTYIYITSDKIQKFVRMYNMNSKEDAIVNMFIIPQTLLIDNPNVSGFILDFSKDGTTFSIGGFIWETDPDQTSYSLTTFTQTAPSTLNGYVPRNGKMLCYPYTYARLTNNGGADFVYRWEDFTSRTAQFKVDASITQGMSIKAFPQNYLNGGAGTNEYEYGVTAQKFPTCSWTTDFYLAWVNQQGANLAIQTGVQVGNAILAGTTGTGIGGAKAGAAGIAGGLVGTGLNVLSTVANTMQQIREASLVPDQARGNVNSGDVNFSIGKSGYTLYSMTIKAEYARQIDDFMTMFGYKTNRVKVPNITGRANWNYVKTSRCYIQADIPQEDLQEIKNMFDNGITIWHNPTTFMDYSQSNAIV